MAGISSISYTLLVFLIQICQIVNCFPLDNGPELTTETSWLYFVISIGSVMTLILVIFACGAGGCCGQIHWFGRSANQTTPLSFSNPMSEPGQMPLTQMCQMDVRALELDPVVFEPLPTIHDLTPLSSQSKITLGVQQQNSENSRILLKNVCVIPFASEDSELFAHDWFDEAYVNFPRGNIEYVKEIGRGWFGQVLESNANEIVPYTQKIKVLVKVLREDASGLEQMRFLDESRLYRDANHGNILKLLGHSIEKLPFLLIMEHCPVGNLKTFLIGNVTRAEGISNRGELLRMGLDIANGLSWMSSNDYTHPDLAARNCQVGSEGRIMIGDYGLGTQLFKDDYYWNNNVPIPLRWAAPETIHCTILSIQTLKVTKASNIWSYGVLLWEIFEFGKLPYFELSDEEVISNVIADNYNLTEPTLPYIPMKKEIYDIMKSCWAVDSSKRPEFERVVGDLKFILQSVGRSQPLDEFDSKWDQLASPVSISNNEDKSKKRVSFMGILQGNQMMDGSFEVSRENESVNDVSFSSLKPKEVETEADIETDQDLWLKSLDLNPVAKVLGKSHSVQDLMVLTHVEQSELDESSLPYVNNESANTYYEEDSLKASSETGINSCTNSNSNSYSSCQNSSSNSESTNSNLLPDIKLINDRKLTPEPRIKIEILPSTPNPINSPTQANFDFKNLAKVRRHTSTPKRSSSSPLPLNDSNLNFNEDVFESPEDNFNQTCPISPISFKEDPRGIVQGEMVTTVIMGGSDELGLDPFQGVTTQMDTFPNSEDIWRFADSTENYNESKPENNLAINPFGSDLTILGQVSNGGAVSLTPRPGQSNEDQDVTLKNASIKSDSWDVVSTANSPSWDILSNNISDGEFWNKQLQSVQMAAVSTKNLFEESLSLDPDKFKSEIKEINEELGSLVLHDLEDSTEQLVPNSKIHSPKKSAKLAFLGDSEPEIKSETTTEVQLLDSKPGGSKDFIPSKWNNSLAPVKPAIKSPESTKTNLKKSVSFENNKQIVYQYPPPIEFDEEHLPIAKSSFPIANSLDWEMTQEDLEDAEIHDEDEDEEVLPKADKLDVYRICGVEDEQSPFKIRSSSEPFVFQSSPSSTLGELRHTRDKLKLDLSRGEASLLDEGVKKLDSGVGSSNEPEFNCDMINYQDS